MLHALQCVVSVLTSAVAIGALAPSLVAQCSSQWSSTGPQAELSGQGECTALWDPDGAGPEPQRLVIGGRDLIGGAEPIRQRVMTWDGSRWQALGPGPGTTGSVFALTVWNGQLVAAGDFTGGGIDRVALWDGTAWQPIGPGAFTDPIHDLTVWNGNLVAAETLLLGGALPVSTVCVWNGAAWSPLGPPWFGSVHALASYQGLLCVGGEYALFPDGLLGRYDGTNWLPLITADARITSLAVRTVPAIGLAPELFVGGAFTSIGGTAASHIAVTTGGPAFAWNAIGGGLPLPCDALHVRNNGFGYAIVALAGAPMQFQGSGSWTSMGGSIALESVAYYGGSYHAARSLGIEACWRYDGTSWTPMRGPGFDDEVHALTRFGNDVIVGGTFSTTADGAMGPIARWDGTTFHPLGTGIGGPVGGTLSVDALLTLDNGDVVVGGWFASAGGGAANSIARWNGSAWSTLGTGLNNQVQALCKMPNGDIVAGGLFTVAGGLPCARIARWNGTGWSPLGSGMNGTVQALAVRSDGVLFAGGSFSTAGGVTCSRVAQWNGSAWLPLGVGCDGEVQALAVRPNDEVVAVGTFTIAGGLTAHRCARWLVTGWATMEPAGGDVQFPRAVVVLPNGDVVAGRGFHQSAAIPDDGISRWNGSTWSAIGNGLAGAFAGMTVQTRALMLRQDGTLIAGGLFSVAGGAVSRNLAALSSTCPPAAPPFGTGCSSPAGPLVITADTLPWPGSSFRTTTTGTAPGSLCLGVIGFTPVSIPLASVLAQGQPGCSLLAAPDIVVLLQPSGAGTWQSALALAPGAALVGATFYQQSIPLEFDAGGALVAMRSSNGLAATIGAL